MSRSLQSSGVLDTLGKRLRHTRTTRGIKIGELAHQLGISRTSLNQWESGAVKNPDTIKLGEFSRICDCNLDWLIKGESDEEKQELATSARRPRTKRSRSGGTSDDENALKIGSVVPEVASSLTAHAQAWDMTPRAHWSIPEQILELGFNAEPKSCIMERVSTRDGAEFGLDRGDYVLIDTSRRLIDEPGIYILADPRALSAHRALVTAENTTLRITVVADDDQKVYPRESADNPTALGRVMGIFKPA